MRAMRDLPVRVTSLESQILQLRQTRRVSFPRIRDQLKADTDETRAFMRVLHEDVSHATQADWRRQ
jgi:hypothetical protein